MASLMQRLRPVDRTVGCRRNSCAPLLPRCARIVHNSYPRTYAPRENTNLTIARFLPNDTEAKINSEVPEASQETIAANVVLATTLTEDSQTVWANQVRAYIFFSWSVILALPLLLAQTIASPFVIIIDSYRRTASLLLQGFWAKLCIAPFFHVEIEGQEKLPDPSVPVVYVANHQSFLDIYSLLTLRPFKFISKASIFLLPIVGWSMFLSGHIGLHRMDNRSQLECLKQCQQMLGHGASVLFFPEGHRSDDGVLAGFKKGAFSVAIKAGVPVVPITLLGTGHLMPAGAENQLRGSGKVRLVIHEPIVTKGRDAKSVCAQARDAVASALPPQFVGSATKISQVDDE